MHHQRALFSLVCAIVISSCSISSSGASPEDLAATMVAGTQEASDASVGETAVQEATSTEPPATQIPTNTPQPEPTVAPTEMPQGPISVEDDFSQDTGIWADCDYCEVINGKMQMGPFPASYAYEQQWAICETCGMVSTFVMTVDVTFVDGPSERGYGLVLNLNHEEFYTYEVTPWQTMDFWRFDYSISEWEWVNGIFSGSVRAGKQPNTISVEVSENSAGQIDYSLSVNGRTPLVIFGRDPSPGWVGITLYGHAVEILIDNFKFETEETPIFPASPGAATSSEI